MLDFTTATHEGGKSYLCPNFPSSPAERKADDHNGCQGTLIIGAPRAQSRPEQKIVHGPSEVLDFTTATHASVSSNAGGKSYYCLNFPSSPVKRPVASADDHNGCQGTLIIGTPVMAMLVSTVLILLFLQCFANRLVERGRTTTRHSDM